MSTQTEVSHSARLASGESSELVKGLGLTSATTIVMGSMIGSGIFIVSADIGRLVDSPALLILAWVITGFMTVTGALAYGELAAMMPQAGGQYVYLREAYGPLVSFLCGWTFFLAVQSGSIATVAVGFAQYLGDFFPFGAARLPEIAELALFEGAILQLQCDLRRPPEFGFEHAVHHAHGAGNSVHHGFAEITLAGFRFFGFGHGINCMGTLARVQCPNGASLNIPRELVTVAASKSMSSTRGDIAPLFRRLPAEK